MRISDWSSDVCSSDLNLDARTQDLDPAVRRDSAREDTANAERAAGGDIAVRRKFLLCAKAESRIYTRNERISNARRRSRDSAVRTIADVLDNDGIRIPAARITRLGEALIAGDLGIEIAEGQIDKPVRVRHDDEIGRAHV